MSKEIPLTQGKVALVDDEDYESVNQYKWYANNDGKTFYARRNIPKGPRRQETILLHRVILDAPKDMTVDHINGDGLDCRRENLRLATKMENNHNHRHKSNNKSGYTGVFFRKDIEKWAASIGVENRRIHLGMFSSPEEAAYAYDKAAKVYYGEFARFNLSFLEVP